MAFLSFENWLLVLVATISVGTIETFLSLSFSQISESKRIIFSEIIFAEQYSALVFEL